MTPHTREVFAAIEPDDDTGSGTPGPGQRFVVIGTTVLARCVCASLRERGHTVDHLLSPGDDELHQALTSGPSGVAVLLHQDDMALRYALAAAHLAPEVPLVAAIFDATMSQELARLLPQCQVTSPADLAAPTLAAACLDPTAAAILPTTRGRGEVFHIGTGQVRASTWTDSWAHRLRAARGRAALQLWPHEAGARLLVMGLLGIIAALLSDWIWLVADGVPVAHAFQEAASVVATVGPMAHHGDGYAVFSGISMLLTVVFAGMFTAGLVEVLLGPRLVGLFGQRALPRAEHVVVIGLGQVGLRLCRNLQALGVPVVGVERDAGARYVGIARSLGIPVVIGHGGDRLLLERLRLRRARALAAVGSADLDNISVAVTARRVAPDTPVVLRAGEHEAISETASLLPLGQTRDVTRISSAYVVARLLGCPAAMALPYGDHALLQTADGRFRDWTTTRRDECDHVRWRSAAAD
jgi:Trk K+ transport system NAD-binding subunit